ncbi:chemotaxis protein [Herbaspirillum hiltneri N3]|uniref:Chemotaxis protein n=1 Tax=Herbaspirillum hiltneri N3 TaxID=1262470 RepID=A0ABN4HYU2_9BURK|nr:methyl-accepting chemotaxis protein [Herbaspirillum hiltneri]AKZ64118.1 chemotaxis protein [Herbaspirillum hiltneri N3]
MRWFYNLKISHKLIISFLIVLVLCIALGIFALKQITEVKQSSSEIMENWLPSTVLLAETKASTRQFRIDQLHLLAIEIEKRPEYITRLTDRAKKLRAAVESYKSMASAPEEMRIFPLLASRISEYLAQNQKMLVLLNANKTQEATSFSDIELLKAIRDVEDVLNELIKVNKDGAVASYVHANQIYSLSRIWIFSQLIVTVVIGLGLAIWIANVVSKPLAEAVKVARQVASGDLTTRIAATSTDETGQLMRALSDMNESLLGIVGNVRTGTDTIATASAQISTGNRDLSSRTEQQASSIEETASAMEELTSTVKQNADNARQANQLATSASTIAQEGGDVVGEVVHTMSSINESSRKIVDIISVIDGIAFQTNILALNAAVEAARAGEQGRGFAVVASEVRSLAQRSSAAAKEIKILIDASVSKVDTGSKQVEQAGFTMTQIVTSVKQVSDIVGEISSASQEQSDGIENIGRAIAQLDETIQQNAALVEEAAAAAQSMEKEASTLSEVVSVFRLRA